MINDSTMSSIDFEISGKNSKSPRQSSILFIKQFARIYIPTATNGISMYSLN